MRARVAKDLVSRITSYEDVARVVFFGASVRSFADRTSDLDIIVILTKKDEKLSTQIRKMVLDETGCPSVDVVGLSIEFLKDLQ